MQRSGWHKFAILGSTYARALENVATRSGRALSPAMETKLTQIRAQPQARVQRGLGDMFREHATGGVLQPTAQQASMQKMLQRTPWAGPDHGGSDHAVDIFNAQLKRRGMVTETPGGDTGARIQQVFGKGTRPGVAAPATNIAAGTGQNPLDHLDRKLQASRAIGLPGLGDAHGGQLIQRSTPAEPLPSQRMSPAQLLQQLHGSSAPAPMSAQNDATAVLGRPNTNAATQVLKTGADRFKLASPLGVAAGIGIPLAVGGGLLASRPGIRANIKNLFAGKGSTKDQDTSGALPDGALRTADTIHQALLAHGLDPATMRVGIDAPPGSGKTTLARALAQRTGMKHHGLDWEPGNWWKSTLGLGRNIEKMPHPPRAGEITEHYMLNRAFDPELFDAQIHIQRDPEDIKQKLQQRGNSAYIADMMDLHKSLGVSDLGFHTLGGDTLDLGDGIKMKLRPREGWGNQLDTQLQAQGVDASGLSRHEKLLSLHQGKRTLGAGWTPYVKNPLTPGQTTALGASVPLGLLAAHALGR
jgi:hypothetical protein